MISSRYDKKKYEDVEPIILGRRERMVSNEHSKNIQQ